MADCCTQVWDVVVSGIAPVRLFIPDRLAMSAYMAVWSPGFTWVVEQTVRAGAARSRHRTTLNVWDGPGLGQAGLERARLLRR